MFKRNKRLLIATVAALLLLGGYSIFVDNFYFAVGESSYPEVNESEARQIVADLLLDEQDYEVSPDEMVAQLHVNADAERFIQQNGLAEQYTNHAHTPPVSMWQVTVTDWEYGISADYFIDLMTGDLVGFLDSSYYDETIQDEAWADDAEIAQYWLSTQGLSEDFTYVKDEVTDEGIVIHHFTSKQPVADQAPLLLKVYTLDGWFIGFYPKLDVPESEVTGPFIEALSGSLSIFFSFGYMGLIFIVGLIYWAMRATDKSLTAPVPILTGIVILIIGALMMTSELGLLQGLMTGFLVFMAMLAVYSKRNKLGDRSPKRMAYLREKVLQGYLVAIITFVPSFLFYLIAEKVFDTWGSSADVFLMLEEAQWIVLTPFLIGMFAAVSEEIMYRKFGEFVFKRVWNNQVFIALVTSFVWAAAHLGYTVHPWYLRIVELTFFVGPFFYWVYKKYGLSVSIMAHYLFNCLLICLTLMSFDADRYVYTLLFLLVPLLVYVIPAKRRTHTHTPTPSVESQSV